MKVKETFKKMLTRFLLVCNVFSVVYIPTVFAQESPSKGDIQDPVIQSGSLASDGDVQVVKTVTKTDTVGKYNVNFTVKGLPVTGSTVVEKPLYVAVVFDRSGSMLCDDGTSTRGGGFGSSQVATINGQNLYCDRFDTVRLSKWNDAVNGAIDFSRALVAKDNTYVSLITFAGSATSGTDFSRNIFKESDFGYPNGGTNLNSALNNAAAKLNSISGDVQKVVLVISDGEPSNINTCISTANSMKATNGITIYSVGYGVSEGSRAEQTLTSISSNSETDTSYYVRAGEGDGAEDIASVLSSLVDQISKSAAGTNAVMKDTIGDQFHYVSSNVDGVLNTDQTVTYNIGTITEEGVSFDFDIEIDPTTPTGWYDTNNVANNGVVLTYVDVNNQTREIVLTSSPKVYWVGQEYAYTINYYKDSISESNHLGTVSNSAEFGTLITADTTLYLPEGYKFVGTAPSMTIQVNGNNIDVVYVKETYNYTINYYKDSISESNHLGTVSETALFGDKITADTTLYLPEGYKFVGTAPSMTIQVNGNNIDVVYVKETYNYTINYYKDSISESNHLGTVSDTALLGDKITADTTLYLPEGYKFVGTAPSMTIQINGNNIDVVYVKETYNYTINYYKDSISESNHLGTVSDTALFGDKITADTTLYLPEGYKFVGTAPSMMIQVNGNNIDVVYVKGTYNYTINYYKDSILESNHLGTVSETALLGDKITVDTTLYLPEGYKFVGTAPSMMIQVNGNNIDVVYVKDEFDYIVEYYFDGVLDESLTESYVALYGDVITEYVDKAKENYILDINHPVNVPLVIDTQNNVIKVYYVFDEGSIVPPYTGDGEDNNLWNMLFFLFSSALLVTFMKKPKEN